VAAALRSMARYEFMTFIMMMETSWKVFLTYLSVLKTTMSWRIIPIAGTGRGCGMSRIEPPVIDIQKRLAGM